MSNILRKSVKLPVKFYKNFISAGFGPVCRFEPSCSTYMVQALDRHGVIKGLFLGIWRIIRCNPWHNCTRHDPVPESFQWPIDRSIPIRYKRKTVKEN